MLRGVLAFVLIFSLSATYRVLLINVLVLLFPIKHVPCARLTQCTPRRLAHAPDDFSDHMDRALCVAAGLKVIDVKFHSGGSSGGNVRHIISTDARSSKVWSQSTAATYTVLEPEHADINDVCVWPGSGFMVRVLLGACLQ